MNINNNEVIVTIPLNMADPGDVLAEEVRNNKGQKVVSSGVKLTDTLIKRLTGAGVQRVEVFREEEEVSTPGYETEAPQPEQKDEKSTIEVVEKEGHQIIEEDLDSQFMAPEDVTLQGDLEEGGLINASGDVEIRGEVKNGIVRAMDGEIIVMGDINTGGDSVQLISQNPIQVSSIKNSQLSVRGDLLIRGEVREADIECIGNVSIHENDQSASISDSTMTIHGKLFADNVGQHKTEPNDISFRDPELVQLKNKKQKKQDSVEELRTQAEKLGKVVKTVQELGDKVKNIPEKKKKELEQQTKKYKKVVERLENARETIDDIETELENIKDQRRYFMRVLEDLKAETTIQHEDTELTVSDDEWDVKLYKKGMIVIQNADSDDDSQREEDWLNS
ncbi:MAG: FapA family protein [bacterium]